MKIKRPNTIIAPIIIAGITFGLLVSAYKFIFAQQSTQANATEEEDPLKQES